jgi:hypothetical protein
VSEREREREKERERECKKVFFRMLKKIQAGKRETDVPRKEKRNL